MQIPRYDILLKKFKFKFYEKLIENQLLYLDNSWLSQTAGEPERYKFPAFSLF